MPATSFFISLVNNSYLDGSKNRPGYTVFGKVTQGMDVVDKIGAAKTGRKGIYSDVPVKNCTDKIGHY